MKKRLLSLALSLVMLLTVLPVSVWAEMADNRISFTGWDTLPPVTASEDESGDELLLGYLYEQAGLTEKPTPVVNDRYHVSSPAMMGVARGTVLTGLNKAAYDAAKTLAEQVAAGSADTAIVTVSDEAVYTAEQAGVEAFTRENIKDAVNPLYEKEERLNLQAVQNALLADLPFDVYWYDKTVGTHIEIYYSYSFYPQEVTLTAEYRLYFTVAESYAAGYIETELGTYRCVADTTKTGAAKQAAVTARGVADSYSDKQDYEKLQSYLTYVDGQVSYDSYAANEANKVPYGDPWQLIYVFDGDNKTNVVCEGYAKAFKFLCDLSKWSDPDFDCYLVTGTMNGGTGAGKHMWNIVYLGGQNYLVDPTNCDKNTIGWPDKLFMREWESGQYDGIYSFTDPSITYEYDDDTKATFTPEELKLKGDPTPPAQQPRLMWRNNHYDWVGEECFTTHELWDEVNVSMGQVIEGQFVFGTDEAYETLDPQTLGYEGAAVLNPREEDTTDLVLEAVAFGTMTVTYHRHEDEDYTLPVTVGLPDVGFYSHPTASKENYLTEWRYNGSNTVYLVWPQGATDVTILPDEHSHTKATATMANGYATITITGLQDDDVAFEVSYQLSGREVRTHVHLRVVDVRPGLGFYHVRRGESGYAREDGAALERSFGTMGKGRHREVQFVIAGAEEAIVKLSNLVYDEEYIEVKDLGNNCVELAFNKFGETELSVTVGEDTYTMPITIGLPDLGFYSSPEASTETYLDEWVYTGEDSVIYLICQNGTLTEVTGADDNASGVSATILKGGKAAEIRLTKLPEGHLDVRADYTRDDGAPDHGDAGVGFLMPQLVVNLSLPEGVSDAAVILWDKEGTAALEPQPEMRRIGSMAVFPNVGPGEYRLTVEHEGCATRTYAITVTQDTVTVLDASLVALGNVNGAMNELGQAVDVSDMQCLFGYLSQGQINSSLVNDKNDSAQVAYFRSVADVNNDGLVNILDYQTLYEMVKAQ